MCKDQYNHSETRSPEDQPGSGKNSQQNKPADPVKSGSQTTVRLAVRSLAETVYRRGGLGGPVYGGVSASEGQRLHKRFTEKLVDQWPENDILTEKTVRHQHQPSSSGSGVQGAYAN